MKALLYLLKKEFIQVFRDKSILKLIVIMPFIQLIIIPNVANYEVKNIYLTVVDKDNTQTSKKLIHKIFSSQYFIKYKITDNYNIGIKALKESKSTLLFEIPKDFEKNVKTRKKYNLLIAADAVNGMRAGISTNYLSNIIQQFNQENLYNISLKKNIGSLEVLNLYNPYMKYSLFMSTGILAILLTIITSAITSLSIVKEKEFGTIEQINVTPIKKYIFILGKLLPALIIGLFIFSFGLVLIYFLYKVQINGSVIILYLYVILYLISILGLGLFISSISENQQQAILYIFFLMLIFILLSGMYTPIESMPNWAQKITIFNPPRHFIKAIRSIILKGSSFYDLKFEFFITLLFSILFNFLAIMNYKKQV